MTYELPDYALQIGGILTVAAGAASHYITGDSRAPYLAALGLVFYIAGRTEKIGDIGRDNRGELSDIFENPPCEGE